METNCTTPQSSIKLPALLLQPILENAIIHGVLGKEGNGLIKLKIDEFTDHFIFSISDNGIGFKSKKSKKIEKKESYGMEILRQRIKLYNSDKYKESDLSVTFLENGNIGTIVNVKLYKL